jgi:hypothetical protein
MREGHGAGISGEIAPVRFHGLLSGRRERKGYRETIPSLPVRTESAASMTRAWTVVQCPVR